MAQHPESAGRFVVGRRVTPVRTCPSRRRTPLSWLEGFGDVAEGLAKTAAYRRQPTTPDGLSRFKKEPVEKDCDGLIEFIETRRSLASAVALRQCLTGYQNPVPREVIDFQIQLAVREASDLDSVPPVFRKQ